MTDSVTAPDAATAAPAAAATVVAAVDAPASLVPATAAAPAASVAAPVVADTTVAAAAAEAKHAEWFYKDGMPGEGEAPVWYKADKYKTVEKQAEAYSELEKRFGAFTGAPKNGKYEIKAVEGTDLVLDTDHPLSKSLVEWAASRNLNQDGFNEAISMLAQYEASKRPDMGAIKASLGEKADERIQSVIGWANANMPPDKFQSLRTALSGHQAAAVLEVIEAAVAKTVQPPMPKPGADVTAAQPGGHDAIKAAMGKRDANGKLLYFTDSSYRAQVEAQIQQHHQAA